MATGSLPTEIQALFSIDSVHALSIHVKALAQKQNMNPTISVPYPGRGDVADSLPQHRTVLADG
jgi:hypothetical protein